MDGGQREAWDSFYRANGRAWRGSCRLPDPLGGDGRALDAGCGSGKSASTLIDMGYRVAGIDVSEEAVSICRSRFGAPAEFLRASVLDIPYPDSAFDYAVAVHVIGHLPDADARLAFSELGRVLRPGGALFVRDFAPGDLREESRRSSGIDYFHRSVGDVLALCGGFDVVSSEEVEEPTRFGGVRRRAEALLSNRKQ